MAKYMYCKLLKWFIDKVNIEEHGFTRACIWMKSCMVLYIVAPPNLVCNSMSIIGVWELCAMSSWWEPPLESLIP